VTCGSIILENLAGNEVTRWNFFEFTPDGYEPGNDGRVRFTLKQSRLPDNYAWWELGGPDPFGKDGSNNYGVDLLVEIEGINQMFYPVVEDDEINHTLTFTYDIYEGFGIFDWVTQIVSGIVNKHIISVIRLDENHNELWRMNYFETFPIKYEIIDGFGLDTKLKARLIVSYDIGEIG
jgi:hypothetical protein